MIIVLSAGRDAPVELRQRLAMDEATQRGVLSASHARIGELALLCTCHRTEVYATADGPEADAIHAMAAIVPGLRATDQHDIRVMAGLEAVEHLFRVACGLDSLVVGEPQVLGQVRRALGVAQEEGSAGPVLANIFGRAIRVGRRARAETALGGLGQSVGSIAADYLDSRFGGLSGLTAAVVGAGEAATDSALALRKAGCDLLVVSRSRASARRLSAEVDGESHTLDALSGALGRSAFAIVAVQGGVLVHAEDVPPRTPSAPYVIIDLSVPRAVDARGRADVDVRSLEAIPGPRGPEVTDAVLEAEVLVRREVAELARWADTRASAPVIRALRSTVEAMVRDEIARATSGEGFTPDQLERVQAMATRIANKLLHGPTTELRDADEDTRALILRMFGLGQA